jgi:LacI family transcriptional regulator
MVGFDDVLWSAFHRPSVTMVRQPLGKMGQIAAEAVIRMIEGDKNRPALIVIEPTLAVRESTGPAKKG